MKNKYYTTKPLYRINHRMYYLHFSLSEYQYFISLTVSHYYFLSYSIYPFLPERGINIKKKSISFSMTKYCENYRQLRVSKEILCFEP